MSRSAIEFRNLRADDIEDALRVQRESMKHECVAIGVGMFDEPGAPEEMQLIFREVIKDGYTFVGVDTETGKVVAAVFNKLHVLPTESPEVDELAKFVEENIQHRSCLNLIEFLSDIESCGDIFGRYGTNAAMELFYIGIDPKYQGRGIGKRITEFTIDSFRQLAADEVSKKSVRPAPEVIFGVFASNYSQRIADQLGFETLVEIPYQDFVIEGARMSDRIGDVHKTAKLAALKI